MADGMQQKQPQPGEDNSLEAQLQRIQLHGNRLRVLNSLFMHALDTTLQPLPSDALQSLTSGLPAPYCDALSGLHGQVYEQIRECCWAEFADIVKDSGVDVTLNQLDLESEKALGLMGDNVNPKQVIAAERVKLKQLEAETLERMLEEVQSEQQQLESSLKLRHEQMEQAAKQYSPIPKQLKQVEDAAKQWASLMMADG